MSQSNVTFVSVIPTLEPQGLDMVGYGVHSTQTTWRMRPKWCCMTGLEDSICEWWNLMLTSSALMTTCDDSSLTFRAGSRITNHLSV